MNAFSTGFQAPAVPVHETEWLRSVKSVRVGARPGRGPESSSRMHFECLFLGSEIGVVFGRGFETLHLTIVDVDCNFIPILKF